MIFYDSYNCGVAVTLTIGQCPTDEETEVLLLGPSAAKEPDYA